MVCFAVQLYNPARRTWAASKASCILPWNLLKRRGTEGKMVGCSAARSSLISSTFPRKKPMAAPQYSAMTWGQIVTVRDAATGQKGMSRGWGGVGALERSARTCEREVGS